MPMAMYMKGDRPFSVFLFSNPGIVFLMAIAALPISCALILRQYLASSRSLRSHFSLIVMINIFLMTVVLGGGEIIIRMNSYGSKEGETFEGRMLLPKNWEKVARQHRELVETIGQGSGEFPSMVHDDLLGWTIASNTGSGLYWSSSEGTRASNKGSKIVSLPGTVPIALLGDSVTFAQEVAYEDSWGYFLEKQLGPGFRVLNFGVGGYGVDQVYLRYEKNVRNLKPKVVIYGFMAHAAVRTMMVYPFISLPNLNIPFSKPRLILSGAEVKKVNVPVLPPAMIFSRESISELPFLEYDAGYKQSEWQPRFFHLSYLARFLVSRFTPWSAANPELSEEALVSVNKSILKSFIQSVTQSGAIPIVVYFPQTQELDKPSLSMAIGKRILGESNIAYVDMTPCLLRLKSADRVVPSGAHFSSQGNEAIANCLLPIVNQALADSKDPATQKGSKFRSRRDGIIGLPFESAPF